MLKETLPKVKISLDSQRFQRKPEKWETAIISNRIASLPTEVTMQEFAQAVVIPNGRSFAPAVFREGIRKNAYWLSQQVFALDIDEDLSVADAINRCERYDIMPNFVYTTFRSTPEHEKFRMVFLVNEEIHDIRVRELIQRSLMTLFSEADIQAKDASRLLFGGKELVYEAYDNVISVPDLLNAVILHIKAGSNPSRDMERFCRNVGIDLINGYPNYKLIDENDEIASEDNLFISMTKKRTNPIIFNRERPKISHGSYMIKFSKENTEEYHRKDEGELLKDHCFKIDKLKESFTQIRDFPFEKLEENCKLYRQSICGEYWLYHNEMFGVMTNLLRVKGGKTKVEQILNSRPEYAQKKTEWKVMINQIQKSNYAPSRCDSYCPFATECEHALNMIEQGKLFRGRIQVTQKPNFQPLEDAEKKLKQYFHEALNSEENGVFVIKAPTGIGKTQLYVNAAQTHTFTIALPTHRLKEEVSQRLNRLGCKHVKVPQLPDLDIEFAEKIERLYNNGAYKAVNAFLKKMARQNEKIQEYLQELENVHKARNQIILTTHQRILFTKDDTNDTLVIDEDIIPSLLAVSKMSVSDFTLVCSKLMQSKENRAAIFTIQNMVLNAPTDLVQERASYLLPNANEVEKIIVEDSAIKSDILGFLNCSYFVKTKGPNGNEFIYFIQRHQLPKKKVIILSATISEAIAKMMFGPEVKYRDIGLTESKGEIVQIPIKSFSRYAIKENQELLDLAKKLIDMYNPNSAIITYKGFMEQDETIPTFGNTEGIDSLKGQNITVLGTPHVNPITYLLYSAVLGYKLGLNDSEMEYQPVQRNGFRFFFNTYGSNEILQEIQFYLIESQLIQAIGRARILREDAKVLVLSNLPVQGARFIHLSQRDIQNLLHS
ncbi:hypothetical protein JEG43_02705 [Anoxybacillus sp. LAT_35]|uniref:hypothetical protein n=1 Tax=unclassified Anoxybacillus TaxID=2639704 RepID=UPI001EDB3F31|nr:MULTISPECIES: hypothetical protein [unclassified Anoxybacillus]MCG5025159.1 hypothetical protein [Anoxybacillus flavithermus]MCG3083052.1 hypothetical protein [Anoxybacillus sp. LAT27]MCG3084976.1 hypothetical protein [Anoxybacillus sp. LAT27]MCG6171726.1 hypothetical protein [Anoxybacillus sp. LAT_11]MCG6175021.1 hypothetical protein [Anoxybacillus sp. LAT_31]